MQLRSRQIGIEFLVQFSRALDRLRAPTTWTIGILRCIGGANRENVRSMQFSIVHHRCDLSLGKPSRFSEAKSFGAISSQAGCTFYGSTIFSLTGIRFEAAATLGPKPQHSPHRILIHNSIDSIAPDRHQENPDFLCSAPLYAPELQPPAQLGSYGALDGPIAKSCKFLESGPCTFAMLNPRAAPYAIFDRAHSPTSSIVAIFLGKLLGFAHGKELWRDLKSSCHILWLDGCSRSLARQPPHFVVQNLATHLTRYSSRNRYIGGHLATVYSGRSVSVGTQRRIKCAPPPPPPLPSVLAACCKSRRMDDSSSCTRRTLTPISARDLPKRLRASWRWWGRMCQRTDGPASEIAADAYLLNGRGVAYVARMDFVGLQDKVSQWHTRTARRGSRVVRCGGGGGLYDVEGSAVQPRREEEQEEEDNELENRQRTGDGIFASAAFDTPTVV
ncbi:hypothetical protein B0H11DRAFT_2187832 [Mycena galericulata]|nr:hypothetical protein B0H11DRAFT_2187832 [Mycena galericulata]